ncbi:MAG TPA: NusG domain II-containing protein [Firmicutes bacterium]|nr:NusG domain II-containing protein [Bacillota bacterium]
MNPVRKNDLLFFLILLCILIILGLLALAERRIHSTSTGGELIIERPGETFRYSLEKDRTFSIGTHTVEISSGRVRVTEAHCPLKVCEKQGWVAEGVIICAPNKTVLIVHPASEGGFDVITR